MLTRCKAHGYHFNDTPVLTQLHFSTTTSWYYCPFLTLTKVSVWLKWPVKWCFLVKYGPFTSKLNPFIQPKLSLFKIIICHLRVEAAKFKLEKLFLKKSQVLRPFKQWLIVVFLITQWWKKNWKTKYRLNNIKDWHHVLNMNGNYHICFRKITRDGLWLDVINSKSN